MRTFEHSTDGGETWKPIEVGPRSILRSRAVKEFPYDDGFNNLYRPTQSRTGLVNSGAA